MLKPTLYGLMKRKTKRFKQNNLNLYRLFIGFLIFMGPIAGATMLFAAPLLGYLAVTANSIQDFLIVLVSILLMSYVFIQFYFLYWPKAELHYLQLSMGKHWAIFQHFVALNRQAALFHLLVLGAFFRIDLNLQSAIYVLLCYATFFLVFLWRYRFHFTQEAILRQKVLALFKTRERLSNADNNSKLLKPKVSKWQYFLLHAKLYAHLMRSGGWLRLLLFTAMTILLVKLGSTDIATIYIASIGFILILLSAFFVHLLRKLMLTNYSLDQCFWLSVSPQFEITVRQNIQLFSAVLITSNFAVLLTAFFSL